MVHRPAGSSLLALLPAALLLTAPPARAQLSGPPDSMAAAGDSITQGFNSASASNQYGDTPANSWSTGSNPAVGSQATRLMALHPALVAGAIHNDSVTGAKVSGGATKDLTNQINGLVPQRPAYVTLLIGANDACTGTEAAMTAPVDFQTDVDINLTALFQNLPDSRVLVASIPDAYQLWTVFHGDGSAIQAWTNFHICPSMLADAGSSDPADVDRRARVRQRIVDYNAILQASCERSLHCRYDGDALFNVQFAANEVSHTDYFHPSVAGQTRLAATEWGAGFDFCDTNPPHSEGSVVNDGGSNAFTFTAVDDVAVRGVEYRINGALWTPWDGGVVETAPTDLLRFRAVDVNGNTEATWTFLQAEGFDGGSAGLSDAGRPEACNVPDAGEDAGTQTDGGGGGGIILPKVGCGCESGPGGIASFALLGAWLVLRGARRRS